MAASSEQFSKATTGKVLEQDNPHWKPTNANLDCQKRKRLSKPEIQDDIDTSKPTAVFEPAEGRAYTLSIALPGSIISK